jgi:hypothetical protein
MKLKAQGVTVRQNNIILVVGKASEVDDNIDFLSGSKLLDIFDLAY